MVNRDYNQLVAAPKKAHLDSYWIPLIDSSPRLTHNNANPVNVVTGSSCMGLVVATSIIIVDGFLRGEIVHHEVVLDPAPLHDPQLSLPPQRARLSVGLHLTATYIDKINF